MSKRYLAVLNLAVSAIAISSFMVGMLSATGCSQADASSTSTAKADADAAAKAHANAVPATVGATIPGIGTNAPAKALPAGSVKRQDNSTESKETSALKTEKHSTDSATPISDISDLFAPPKIVVPVVQQEKTVEKVQPATVTEKKVVTPPPLRLLGFVEVEGLKAMLSIDGKLNVITVGDSIEGVQILAVEPPAVMLSYSDQEFQIDLFEQPWFHQPDTILGATPSLGGKPVHSSNPMPKSTFNKPTPAPALPPIPAGRPAATSTPYPAPGGSSALPAGFPATISNDVPRLPAPPTANGVPALPGLGAHPDGLPGLPKLSAPAEKSAGSSSSKSRKSRLDEDD